MASTPTYKDDQGRPCVPNNIDGKAVSLPPTSSFPVTSAGSGKVVHYGQSASVEVAVKAVESAASTFRTYKTTAVPERRAMLIRAADLFAARREEFVVRQVCETNCADSWAQANMNWVDGFLRELASSITTAVSGEIPPSAHPGCTSLVLKQPIGTVMIIPP